MGSLVQRPHLSKARELDCRADFFSPMSQHANPKVLRLADFRQIENGRTMRMVLLLMGH
jgi:hypothetical protein